MWLWVGFHSVLASGIILRGNSTNVHQVFKRLKRTIRVMSGVGPRSSCRGLFRKLKILPVACHYILSLILFIINNLKDYPTNAHVHSLDTRNKNKLCLSTVSLADARIFNSLTSSIQSHRNDRKRFKTSYTDTLLHILFIQLLNFWNAS
jgi:hypothetical protein